MSVELFMMIRDSVARARCYYANDAAERCRMRRDVIGVCRIMPLLPRAWNSVCHVAPPHDITFRTGFDDAIEATMRDICHRAHIDAHCFMRADMRTSYRDQMRDELMRAKERRRRACTYENWRFAAMNWFDHVGDGRSVN